MGHSDNLALYVARRQKRLKYWCDRFEQQGQSSDRAAEIKERLNTYRLLLSKLVKASTEQEVQDVEGRVQCLERELTTLFEARRLMTSSIGVSAVITAK
ncbi:MAG: hypothetical protein U0136_14185 [Bdellovibrionota bacterium]